MTAYCRALGVLRSQFGVQSGESKPSDAMVLTLADQLSIMGSYSAYVSRWFWQAIVDQRYAQGANTQILTDIRQWPAFSLATSAT